MKQQKAICTEVEGLLPLYVGADLEQEDTRFVGAHIEECAACAGLLRTAESARSELRRGLTELVDGREPQLWPAIREQLAREGLFSEMAERRSPVPGGERERHPFTLLFHSRGMRMAGGLAASLALIFFAGRGLDFGSGQPGSGHSVRPDAGEARPDGLARELPGPSLGTGTDLFADAGTAEPASTPAGLRPVGLGEKPLFDQAREEILRERQDSNGIFFLPAMPAPQSEGDLASSFSLQ